MACSSSQMQCSVAAQVFGLQIGAPIQQLLQGVHRAKVSCPVACSLSRLRIAPSPHAAVRHRTASKPSCCRAFGTVRTKLDDKIAHGKHTPRYIKARQCARHIHLRARQEPHPAAQAVAAGQEHTESAGQRFGRDRVKVFHRAQRPHQAWNALLGNNAHPAHTHMHCRHAPET